MSSSNAIAPPAGELTHVQYNYPQTILIHINHVLILVQVIKEDTREYLSNLTPKPVSLEYKSKKTSGLRNLDTMTTLSWAASQMSLDDIEVDFTPQRPNITMIDVIAHGYFKMAPSKNLPFPSKYEVEHALPGAERLLEWVCRIFATDANGQVGYQIALEYHPDLNPYMLQPAVEATNAALALMQDLNAFEAKMHKMQILVATQVDAMLARLQDGHAQGLISQEGLQKKTAAANEWQANKLSDMKRDICEKQNAAVVASEAACREMLQVWVIVREQMDQAMQKAMTATATQPDNLEINGSNADIDATMWDAAEGFEAELVAQLEAGMTQQFEAMVIEERKFLDSCDPGKARAYICTPLKFKWCRCSGNLPGVKPFYIYIYIYRF